MFSVLLDRQNPRHIRQRDIRFILQPVSQEIKISLLPVLVPLSDTEHRVPLVDDHHELRVRLPVEFVEAERKIRSIKSHTRVSFVQLIKDAADEPLKRIFDRGLLSHKVRHYDSDDIKFAEVPVPDIFGIGSLSG